MAGHSKWANIKHKKARNDAKRGKVWSKCARAIIVAAKAGGGDPAMNLTLRYAMDEARAENMPKDTIANAVRKGSGSTGGADYESITYEGYGPNGVAVLLEILTDNRNRTAPDIKRTFDKHGGKLGTNGCVAYIFHAKGTAMIPKTAAEEEAVMDIALDAGAEDVIDADDAWQVLCDPSDFIAVRSAIEAAELALESARITMIPDTTVTCTGKDARRVLALVEALDDHDDVQKVHANFDIPDEDLAALED
jgi:YebC/PmpR family DNA-binding regulatory protein